MSRNVKREPRRARVIRRGECDRCGRRAATFPQGFMGRERRVCLDCESPSGNLTDRINRNLARIDQRVMEHFRSRRGS